MILRTAVVGFLTAIFLLAGCSKEPQTFEELVKAGKRAYVDQDYAGARECFLSAYKEQPSNKDVLFFLGISYARDFVYDSAYTFLRRADLLHPNDRAINLELYPLAVSLKEWTQGIQSIRVLIATGDSPLQYNRDLAELHAEKKQYLNAYRYLRQDLEQKPNDTTTYMELANLAELGDTAALAVAILDSAITKFGPTPQLRLHRAGKLASAGKYGAAERDYRDLMSEGDNRPSVRLGLASVLIPQDSREKRIEAYHILKAIQDSTGTLPGYDSTLAALADSLGIDD